MSVPVVALVGDHLRHRWYASRIAAADRIELRALVSERQPSAPRGSTPDEDELVADHFARRSRAEQRHFADVPAWDQLGAPFLAVERGDTNTDEVAAWVRGHEPRYLLLYGCGIIRAPLLDAYDGRTVNLHLGLSPYYRGHGTNFWPLVNGEPECVGATVHLATLDVDAGAVLRQARPELSADDDSHDIGCRAIAAGTQAVLDALPAFDGNELEALPQRAGGRVYRHADFDRAPGAAITELRRRLAEGMIADYLAHKGPRDARFPIVA